MKIIQRKQARADGLKRYFTGLVCPAGHMAERFVSTCACVVCALGRSKKWCRDNRAHTNSNRVRSYHNCKEKLLKKRRDDRLANIEMARAEGRLKYRTQIQKNGQTFFIKKREQGRRWHQRWKAENPDAAMAKWRNGRAKRQGAVGSHSKDDIAVIRAGQQNKCAYCRQNLKGKKSHVDHISPLALGGSNWPSNLQILCEFCNLSKGAKDPVVFAQSLGFLL